MNGALTSLHPVAIVAILGLVTALATGLGALPFVVVRDVGPRTLSRAHALAGGLMLGASFGLLLEGSRHGTLETFVGGGLGVIALLVAQRAVGSSAPAVSGAGGRSVLLFLVVMTIHSFSEGIAVGVAFGGGEKLALLITLAIAVHNVPEGLAISAVMRSRGSSVAACAAWSVVSSLPQPIMAVPAFLFVDAWQRVLPYGLGFAAGAMVLMVFIEILPDAYRGERTPSVGLVVASSFAAMVLFQELL